MKQERQPDSNKQSAEKQTQPTGEREKFDFDFPEIDKLSAEQNGKEEKSSWLKEIEETHDILREDIENAQGSLEKINRGGNEVEDEEFLQKKLAQIAESHYKKAKKSGSKISRDQSFDIAMEDLKKEYDAVLDILSERWKRLRFLTHSADMDDKELQKKFTDINKSKKGKTTGYEEVEARKELIRELGGKISDKEVAEIVKELEEKVKEETEQTEKQKEMGEQYRILAEGMVPPSKEKEIKGDEQEKLAEQYRILAEGMVLPEAKEKRLKIPERRNLSESLNELSEKPDKAEFERLKKQLAGERVYRFIKEGGVREKQYVTLENISKDKEGMWTATLVVYNEDGSEKERKNNYNISKTKYQEWEKIEKSEELPKDGNVYIREDGKPFKLKLEGKKEEEIKLIAKGLRRYEDKEGNFAYKRASLSRSEAARRFKENGQRKYSNRVKDIIRDFEDIGRDIKRMFTTKEFWKEAWKELWHS